MAEHWNSCVINCVHCSISAVDAMCVFHLGERSSSQSHEDAARLLKKINLDPKELSSKTKQFMNLLSMKTLAEYDDRLMTKSDAEKARKNCERIYLWVKTQLP